MIDLGDIRAAARACPGEVVGLTKAQLEQLLGEVEHGYVAQSRLARLKERVAACHGAGTGRVSPTPAAA